MEGREKDNVESWVRVVRSLRYKDFQLVARPGPLDDANRNKDKDKNRNGSGTGIGLEEVESVKDFGSLMKQRGVWRWWRRGMGYEGGDI